MLMRFVRGYMDESKLRELKQQLNDWTEEHNKVQHRMFELAILINSMENGIEVAEKELDKESNDG